MKKPYTNNTGHIVHIGPCMVMPGQTREIEEMYIDAHLGKKAEQAETPTPEKTSIDLILDQKVGEVKKSLAHPDVSAEDLDALETAEKAGKNRNGVLAAITEERLKRATDDSGNSSDNDDLETFIATLPGMSDEELAEQHDLYTDEADSVAYLDAVDAEIEKRKQADAGS